MHFGMVDVEEERDYRRRNDLNDFSLKNKIPVALKATTIEDVVAALEMLSLLVNDIYAPLVAELVDAARRFLLAQLKTKDNVWS